MTYSRPDRRPLRRGVLGAFLGLCILVTVGCLWWGATGFLRFGDQPETDSDRAERVAGLHHDQHPKKGRYYVPAEAVLARTVGGVPVAYLHYGIDGGDDVNVDDFLSTYDLPQPGTAAPLPEDLRAALPGDEPAEGALVPEGQAGRQVFVVRRPGGRRGAADVYVRATGGT
ncbi:hypothetical protein BX285_3572 [Streptomyces sp. 1114.5]|nr:hypothetical protein BX285_3572 [Streptomyces sp. 1114.5]